MKPMEYCLDRLLEVMRENESKVTPTTPKEPFYVPELLAEFELAENHEFFKGFIYKLHDDGYVYFNGNIPNDKNLQWFTHNTYLTVQGYYFLEAKNGYRGEQRRRKITTIAQISQIVLIVLGTVAAGIYGGFEIWRYYFGFVRIE